MIEFERRIKLGAIFVLVVFLGFLLFRIDNLLTSLVLAMVFFYLLNPWVDMIERRGVQRSIAVAIPFLLMVLGLFAATYFTFPVLISQAKDLQGQLLGFMDSANTRLSSFEQLGKTYLSIDLRSTFFTWGRDQLKSIPDLLSQSLTVIFLAPFLGFFMLLDGRELVRQGLRIVPNPHFELALNLNHQIGTQIGGFIRARLVETAIVGMIVWVGLFVLGFPNALSLGVFVGIANLVPYVGPVFGVVPALVLGLANSSPMETMLWVGVIYLLGQLIDVLFIVPLVVARIVNLHPATVVLVVIVGAHFLGILGMIISIPLFSAVKVCVNALYTHLLDFR